MALSFFFRSDLVEAGRDEDGGLITAEVFYVIAEDDAGRRWAHDHRTTDEAEVSRLLVKMSARGEINETYWQPIAAAYGSAAHNEADWYDEDDIASIRQNGGLI